MTLLDWVAAMRDEARPLWACWARPQEWPALRERVEAQGGSWFTLPFVEAGESRLVVLADVPAGDESEERIGPREIVGSLLLILERAIRGQLRSNVLAPDEPTSPVPSEN